MARNGSGTYTLPNPTFSSGTAISSSAVNANNADLSSEITNSLPRDGQAAPTANVPFGGYKITGLGAGSNSTDSATLGQIQGQAYIWSGTAGGSNNALTLTPSPAITSYVAGQSFVFIAGGTDSDDASTIAISGLATKAIQNLGSALTASICIKAGKLYRIYYDGTAFQLDKQFTPDGVYAPLSSLESLYPVGSVYINAAVATNPATLLGFGTWTALGAGRILIGVGTGTDSNSNTKTITLGETGGEYTHQLSEAELPAHKHTLTDTGHYHTTTSTQDASNGLSESRADNFGSGNSFYASGSYARNVNSATTGITMANTGSGTLHNNVQPYIGVHIWQRTA